MIVARRLIVIFGLAGILATAASWLSISTLQRTDQDASIKLVKTIDERASYNLQSILAAEQRTSDNTDSLLKSVQSLGEQNKSLAEQNLEMAKQLKDLQDANQKLLQSHTQLFSEAKTQAKRAANTAEESAVTTRRVIRQLQPKPTLWHRLFATPTPTPYGHRGVRH